MTLLDASYALDELAAGRTPDRTRLLAGVRALGSVRMTGTPVDRELLDAANELHLVVSGGTVSLTKNGRARAAVWAEAVRRIISHQK
jgi:hypothetical protein